MARHVSDATNGVDIALLGYLLLFGALASALAMTVHGLWQPRQLGNPGLAAYEPPPATRLLPLLDRKFDAPPVVAEAEPAPALAFAQAAAVQDPAPPKRDAAPPVRNKRVAKARQQPPPPPQYQAANQSFQPAEWGNRPWF